MGNDVTAEIWRSDGFSMCAHLGCGPQHGMVSQAVALLVNDHDDFEDCREEFAFLAYLPRYN